MTIALSAHPALAPLVGQLAAALPIKGLYYPARRHPDTTLPFFSDLPAMLQATSPRVCAFLSPYADLHNDIHTCLQAGGRRPLRRTRAQGRPAHRHRRHPSRGRPCLPRRSSSGETLRLPSRSICVSWPASKSRDCCRRGGPSCGQLSLASDLLGESPCPSPSLRQQPRSRLPSSADRHGSQRRGNPASRPLPQSVARRTKPC